MNRRKMRSGLNNAEKDECNERKRVITMKPQPMDLEPFFKRMAARGIPAAPPDHPIYSEGVTIILSPRMQKPSREKAIVSHPVEEASLLNEETDDESAANETDQKKRDQSK